jgi:hypothetical protein
MFVSWNICAYYNDTVYVACETLNIINSVLCARNKDLYSSGPSIKLNSSHIIKLWMETKLF